VTVHYLLSKPFIIDTRKFKMALRRQVSLCFLICSLLALVVSFEKRGEKSSQIDRTIKKSLNKEEHFRNTLKVLSWDLKDNVKSSKKICDLITKYNPTFLGFQQVGIKHIFWLKQCFKHASKKCLKPKKFRSRGRGNKSVRRRGHRNCGYEILGAGSSNNEETTLFTPVVFKKKRNIRTTGLNGTVWLSKTPEKEFTKLVSADSFRIASWAYLKLAVYKKRQTSSKIPESGFEKVLMALKRSSNDNKTKRRKGRPSTKWIDLYVVNTQINGDDSDVAKRQLKILLDYLKDKNFDNDKSAILLTAGINSRHMVDLAEVLGNAGFKDAVRDTRAEVYYSGTDVTNIVWSKGIQNLLSVGVSIDDGQNNQEPILSVVTYK